MIILFPAQVTQLSPANTHAPRVAFWLANSTELLHFLETDKHVQTYATEAIIDVNLTAM